MPKETDVRQVSVIPQAYSEGYKQFCALGRSCVINSSGKVLKDVRIELGMEVAAHQVGSGQKGGQAPIPERWAITRKEVWCSGRSAGKRLDSISKAR